ncbi:MAG: monovalent cation/H(+) antiporter subunit G [Pseudomonadota bacterium]
MSGVAEIAAAICLVLGGFLTFIAALGLVRMPDVYIRMHASTKAGTLGVGLIVVALVLVGGGSGVVGKGLAIVAFILITAPIGAHLIGRAAYRAGMQPWQADQSTPVANRDDQP